VVIFDHDVMALSARAAAQEVGIAVPAELSIAAAGADPDAAGEHRPSVRSDRRGAGPGERAERLRG
jgi:DNA-binding LacI/PurR family transcriptional regulator